MIGETNRSSIGDNVVVERHNSFIDGYVPIKRELEGILSLIQGISNVAFGMMAPATNEGLYVRGQAQLKDGMINIVYSPIPYLIIGALYDGYWRK